MHTPSAAARLWAGRRMRFRSCCLEACYVRLLTACGRAGEVLRLACLQQSPCQHHVCAWASTASRRQLGASRVVGGK